MAPLLIDEATTAMRENQLRKTSEMIVWYGTPVEIESALMRRKREGELDEAAEARARMRLTEFVLMWQAVAPSQRVRDRAIRLLRIHPLRAADAFQLAAALIAFEEKPEGVSFYTGDMRLGEAATKEGFTVN